MKNIIKGAALLAALAALLHTRKRCKRDVTRDESRKQGLWRKTAPNPDSYDKYGDMG